MTILNILLHDHEAGHNEKRSMTENFQDCLSSPCSGPITAGAVQSKHSRRYLRLFTRYLKDRSYRFPIRSMRKGGEKVASTPTYLVPSMRQLSYYSIRNVKLQIHKWPNSECICWALLSLHLDIWEEGQATSFWLGITFLLRHSLRSVQDVNGADARHENMDDERIEEVEIQDITSRPWLTTAGCAFHSQMLVVTEQAGGKARFATPIIQVSSLHH